MLRLLLEGVLGSAVVVAEEENKAGIQENKVGTNEKKEDEELAVSTSDVSSVSTSGRAPCKEVGQLEIILAMELPFQ